MGENKEEKDIKALHPKISVGHLHREGRGFLLSKEQIEAVQKVFNDPNYVGLIKIKRKWSRKGEERKTYHAEALTDLEQKLALPYSVVRDKNGQIYALYEGKERLLGTGKFGRVKLAQNLETGEWVALKIQIKESMKHLAEKSEYEKAKTRFEKEAKTNEEVGFQKGWAERSLSKVGKRYDFQVLVTGRELWKNHFSSSVRNSTDKTISQNFIKDLEEYLDIWSEMLLNLKKLHDKNIVHADAHLGNFLYDRESRNAGRTPFLTLIDFGFSKILSSGSPTIIDNSRDLTGGAHAAPEVLPPLYQFSKASDMYIMGNNIKLMLQVLKHYDSIHRTNSIPLNIEQKINTLIKSLMSSNPNLRLSVEATIEAIEAIKILYLGNKVAFDTGKTQRGLISPLRALHNDNKKNQGMAENKESNNHSDSENKP